MSLREEAITHMAQALRSESHTHIPIRIPWPPDMDPRSISGVCDVFAAESLDALLDFLDAHTGEWAVTVIADETPTSSFEKIGAIHKVVAALRGTTEEPR